MTLISGFNCPYRYDILSKSHANLAENKAVSLLKTNGRESPRSKKNLTTS